MRATHLGGPTVLLEVAGWTILSDPTFDPPGRTYGFGLGTSSTKLAGPARPVEVLPPIDVVVLSHDHHADNLDDAGRTVLAGAGTIVTNTAAARRLSRRGGLRDVRGLRPWSTTRLRRDGLPDLVVTATPCRHGPPFSRPVVGSVVGFVLELDPQEASTIWFTGDTVPHRGLRDVARRFTVDVAFVHLGDVRFGLTGPIHYSMTAEEGVRLVEAVKPRVAVPVHYEGWSHFAEGRAQVEAAIASAPVDVRSRFRLTELGERTALR